MYFIFKKIYANFYIFLINLIVGVFKTNLQYEKTYLNIVKQDLYNDILDEFNFFIIHYAIKTIFLKFSKKNSIQLNLNTTEKEVEGNFFIQIVKLDKNTKILKSNYFKNCINLKYVYIPKTISCIETEAFHNCIRLKKIVFY